MYLLKQQIARMLQGLLLKKSIHGGKEKIGDKNNMEIILSKSTL